MPRRARSTESRSYIELSDASSDGGGNDGDIAEIFSPLKRSSRLNKRANGGTTPARPSRLSRVTKPLQDGGSDGSDIEFVGAAASRSSTRQPAARVPSKPRYKSDFLGVFIPKLRPTPEMIREARQKRAAAAEAAGDHDFIAVSVERASSPRYVESSGEDEEDVDIGLGAVRSASGGGTRDPSPAKAAGKLGSRRKARRPSPDSDAAPRKKARGRRDSDDDEASDAPRRQSKNKHKDKNKGKGKQRMLELDESDSDERPRRRKDKELGNGERRRKRRRNSDDDGGGLDEIELDEPERFKTKSRLREVRKSAFQQRLGSLQKKRRGKHGGNQSSSEESSSSSSSEDDRRRRGGRGGPSRGKPASQWKYVQDDLSDFIASDDDIDGARAPPPRHRGGRGHRDDDELDAFTFKRESPEYKFKVVFQYLLVLVMKGPDALLPLRGKNDQYYGRSLRNVRDQMGGIKSSIASVLWRPELVRALKKYPQWKQARLDEEEDRCEACNRSKQACQHEAWLRGSPYHPEKHEDVYDAERAELLEAARRRRRKYKKQGRESSSDSDDPREIGPLGATCLQRTGLWHELHHWEHRLLNDIRHYYHDLQRAKGEGVDTDSDSQLSAASDATAGAKNDLRRLRQISQRRVADLKDRRLPRNTEGVDEVTEWMDKQGYQKDAMRYLTRLEDRARELDSVRR